MNFRDAAAERGIVLHLGHHVSEEEHLAIAGAGDEGHFLALVHDLEAEIAHSILAAHVFEILFPTLAVGRIGHHEIEANRRECVVRKGGPLGAADDVFGILALALEQHVRFTNGVGFRVDFLTVEVGGDLQAEFGCEQLEGFLAFRENPAGAASAVVKQIGAGFELLGDGAKDEIGHQPHGVAGRPVLAGFLVVFLVELADQFLEHGAHRVVVDAGRSKVDFGIEELGNQGAERVGLRECLELVAEFEVFQDVLHVR